MCFYDLWIHPNKIQYLNLPPSLWCDSPAIYYVVIDILPSSPQEKYNRCSICVLLVFSVNLLYRTTGDLSAKQVYNYQNDPLLATSMSPLFNFSNSNNYTPTPWLTLLLVLGKIRVKQNLC